MVGTKFEKTRPLIRRNEEEEEPFCSDPPEFNSKVQILMTTEKSSLSVQRKKSAGRVVYK